MGGLCREFWSCEAYVGEWSRPQYLLWICRSEARLLPSTSLWSTLPWHSDHVAGCWGGGKRSDAVRLGHRDGTLAGCQSPTLLRGSFDWTGGWCEHEGRVWSHGSLSSYQLLSPWSGSTTGSGELVGSFPLRRFSSKLILLWDIFKHHDDVIKWKLSPRYWTFVQGIHRSLVNSLTKASDAELWCFLWSAPWTNGWVNNREAGDLRRYHSHFDIILRYS